MLSYYNAKSNGKNLGFGISDLEFDALVRISHSKLLMSCKRCALMP